MHRRFSLLIACFVFSFLLLFGLTSWLSPPTHARPSTGITVDTLDDELNIDGDCSLREAITAANDNLPVDTCPAGDDVLTDTITFAVGGVITLGQQLSVTAGGPLTIDGGEVITVSGNETTRVLYVNQNSDMRLINIAVVDGYADHAAGIFVQGATLVINNSYIGGNYVHASPYRGGGVYNNAGTLVIDNSDVVGNVADEGSGIYNNGTLTLTNSTISNNRNAYDNAYGGGLYNSPVATAIILNSAIDENELFCSWWPCRGGGIFNEGYMNVTNSSINGNYAHPVGGIDNRGEFTLSNSTVKGSTGTGIINSGSLNIERTTVSDNLGYWYGGGIWNGGVLTITNSTISGNVKSGGEQRGGGGIVNGWEGPTPSTLYIYNSTVYSNTAQLGGGIRNYPGSEAWLLNTIVADSPSGGNCYGIVNDGGHNLDSEDTCGFDPTNDSLINTDPLLGPLQDNGGDTWTHALLDGSQAIDAGDDGACPPIDQRGVVRPQDGDGDGVAICDIGSFESTEYTDFLYFPVIMNSQNGVGISQPTAPALPESAGMPIAIPSITLILARVMAGVRWSRQKRG